jgi:hypothetical protein
VKLQNPPLDTVSSTRDVSAATRDSFIAGMMGDNPTLFTTTRLAL